MITKDELELAAHGYAVKETGTDHPLATEYKKCRRHFKSGASLANERAEKRIAELESQLEWKTIDRKDHPQNFEKMSWSRGFMVELCELQKQEITALESDISGYLKLIEQLQKETERLQADNAELVRLNERWKQHREVAFLSKQDTEIVNLEQQEKITALESRNAELELILKFPQSEKESKLSSALEIAVEHLTSISKNGCCDTCQEAKLVSISALTSIKSITQTNGGKE